MKNFLVHNFKFLIILFIGLFFYHRYKTSRLNKHNQSKKNSLDNLPVSDITTDRANYLELTANNIYTEMSIYRFWFQNDRLMDLLKQVENQSEYNYLLKKFGFRKILTGINPFKKELDLESAINQNLTNRQINDLQKYYESKTIKTSL